MIKETELHESTFAIGSIARVFIDGDYVTFNEGDSQRVVTVMFDDGGDEALTLTFDWYHLAELRKAVQRAEKWIKATD